MKLDVFKKVWLYIILMGIFTSSVFAKSLEYKYIFSLKAVERRAGTSATLEFSGLCGHSAYAVETIQSKQENNDINIIITIVPANKKLSGSFKYEIPISKNVKTVSVGEERHIIWSQKTLNEK